MNRIDRLSAILIQLQSKRVVKAAEISERFGISLRTVYRDIRALEEAGVPIGAEAGVGYFIMEGYSLPAVKFNKEEAGAILMASKLADKQTDGSIKSNLNSALYKIRAALKIEEKEYLESIENNIEVLHSPTPTNNSKFPDHFLTDLQNALSKKRIINFDYYSSYNDTFTNRDVEPLSLCYYSRHWHLIGFCRLRNALRDFRSDRIMKLLIKDSSFDPKKHKDYKGYVESVIQGAALTEVEVSFDNQAARYISEQRYFMGYIESEKLENSEKMKFMTSDLESFARWLISFGQSAFVHSPEKLKNRVIELLEEGLKNYLKKN
ncbi:helix-turn-helix transcriptional regulator [Fulvivirga lutea]|uniref:YafY family transcriptional regulator n=1 Tax=Fulvivirga lutea TaxID=2810512 RepID=A0A974WKH2_9BACT|nr:YafY family protein [Fulvivirga lutea]QSE97023.1 YafY family transcriptional regulator [Fulvivirga lutea]